jgi:hypothetical protein
MVPNAFAVDIQNPARVSGQVITVASLSGSVVPPGELDHARNTGIGRIYKCGDNGMPESRSFTSFLLGDCLTKRVITTRVPINAPNPPSSFYPLMVDTPYTLYFSVRAGLGLIFTPKNDPMLNNNPGGWAGIRYLHATSYTAAALEVPLLTPPPF